MNNILSSMFLILLFAACKSDKKETDEEKVRHESEVQSPVALGQQLFEGVGNCVACHKPDQKIVGPSIREIAKIYKDKNGDLVKFLKGEGKPLVDPSQFEVMKNNFAITKTMSDDELKALETYIYSHLK